ncbi:outer membrane protein assembly factor BamD [Roseimarinus sediminis]|uniref:hypothetical protein n=1 Tax=Roseimarinus sediminis TaxID=1610899 RepID=UPI003D229A57
MKRISNIITLLFVTAVISACSTGKTAFNKGNYYEATLQAVKHLRTRPDSENAINLIQKSYPMALDYYKQRIDQLSLSNDYDKYLKIADTYQLLNALADEISRSPAALEAVKPVVYYHDQQREAEKLALKEQFDNALILLEKENIADAREAYRRFVWVKEQQPSFDQIDDYLLVAKDKATLKVVVEHQPELHENYDINSRVFYLRLFDQMVKDNNSQFISFYRPETAEKIQLEPDHVVSIRFLEFHIGTLLEKEEKSNYQLDSVVVGSYTDDKGVTHDVMGTVKADVRTFSRELPARGILSVTINDFQGGEELNSRKFNTTYVWKSEWASYNGDKKALPNHVLKLLGEKQRMPPSPQEMFLLSSDPLFFDAAGFLKSVYRKY